MNKSSVKKSRVGSAKARLRLGELVVGILATAFWLLPSALAVDTYPTESWPSSSGLLLLDGTSDESTGLPHIAAGTDASSTISLEIWVRRQWDRLCKIVSQVAELRLVQDGTLTVGVFPGKFTIRGTSYAYAGCEEQSGADGVAFTDGDDTYYLWLDATNALRCATDGTGWPADATTFIPLAEVTVSASAITGVVDVRNRRRLATWQNYDAGLADIAALAVTDSNIIVGDGTNWVAESGATARTSLGLGSIATQASNNVSITGGSVTGITDLAVADGGTGASDATNARSNLGLVIGTNVQAYDAELGEIAALADTDGNFIVGDGAAWVAESGATARTSLGLGSIATQAANNVAITGGSVAGITDLAVADGGTGASDATNARSNLGLVIGTNVQAYDAELGEIAALADTDGNFIVGDGAAWVAESGATARTSLGLGTIATLAASTVAGAPSVSAGAENAVPDPDEIAVTITVKDIAGSTIAAEHVIRAWISDTSKGGETAAAPAAVTWTTGTVLQTVTADKQFMVITDSNGVAVVTLGSNADTTWYVNASVTGLIGSAAANFD